ncbi:hypothetical protein TELCIR_11784 [Teladorsagia circumcincta]|uniref:Uncharacterized protein n=1 Tax=Teladorsagia circumcincta TaxID=45464 RepID=A0A2G9UAI4_TELCI|nr:hypothetical protein TELCIR_11784 [Teladorsagia circumcincta]
MEEEGGVDERVTRFVLPLGANINMGDTSESNKIARDAPSRMSKSQAPLQADKADKPLTSKLGTIEVERDVVDKGMAEYVDEAAERTICVGFSQFDLA